MNEELYSITDKARAAGFTTLEAVRALGVADDKLIEGGYLAPATYASTGPTLAQAMDIHQIAGELAKDAIKTVSAPTWTPAALCPPPPVPVSRALTYTAWSNKTDTAGTVLTADWSELCAYLENAPVFVSKDAMPLIRLAHFKDGSRASDSTVILTINGVEGDKDKDPTPYDEVVRRLQAVGIECLVYTTASYIRGSNERLRILAPTSTNLPVFERARLVARLNGALGGVLADDSFLPYLTYFFGHVEGVEYRVTRIRGQFIDLIEGLPEIGQADTAPISEGKTGEVVKISDDDLDRLLADQRIGDLSRYGEAMPRKNFVEEIVLPLATHCDKRDSARDRLLAWAKAAANGDGSYNEKAIINDWKSAKLNRKHLKTLWSTPWKCMLLDLQARAAFSQQGQGPVQIDPNNLPASEEDRAKAKREAVAAARKAKRDAADAELAELYADDPRPQYQITADHLDKIVGVMVAALAATGKVFQKGQVLIVVRKDKDGNAMTVPLNAHEARVWLNELMSFWKYSKQAAKWLPADPPRDIIDNMIGCGRYPGVPELVGISQQPYLRPDGSLILTPGFDATTGIYAAFEPDAYKVPVAPTMADAEAALALIDSLLDEFAFKDPAFDRVMMLTGILTASLRASMLIAPLYLALAYMIDSGKSYASLLMQAFAMGWNPNKTRTPTTVPKTEEEWSKALPAIFASNPAVVWFDNFVHDIPDHDGLCAAIMAGAIKARFFNHNDREIEVQVRAFITGSGINIGVREGMSRRVAFVRLDKAPDKPVYHGDPLRKVLLDRPRFVSAALTITMAWIAAGRPQKQCERVGNFDEWTQLVRQPLLWLGQPDIGSAFNEQAKVDSNAELWGRFCALWREAHSDKPMTLSQATTAETATAFSAPPVMGSAHDKLCDLRKIIGSKNGFEDPQRFASWVGKQSGKWTDDRIRVVKTGDRHNGTALWRLEQRS